jgi:hypothetical protein
MKNILLRCAGGSPGNIVKIGTVPARSKGFYLASTVTPGQSSVRNGLAGKSSSL